MGAHRYCQHTGCDMALDRPTAREDLIDGQLCGRGHRAEQWQSVEHWIADLDDRVRDIESRFGEAGKLLREYGR